MLGSSLKGKKILTGVKNWKLVLKAALFLAVILTCALVLYDNEVVSRIGERINLSEIQLVDPSERSLYKPPVVPETLDNSNNAGEDLNGINGINEFLDTIVHENNNDNIHNDGPYLTSEEVELTVTTKTQWDEFQTRLKFNARYWDLVQSVNPNGSEFRANRNQTNETSKIFSSNLTNLWRPLEQPGPHESNRIIPQLVWQMEAANSSFADRFKEKKIVMWDPFEWWSKPDWKTQNGLKQLEQSDCKASPGSITKCVFTDDRNHVSDADAVVAARDVFHTGDVTVPDNAFRFYFILESPFHSWATLNRPKKDLLATYWRGSDLVTPYNTWAYYDLNVKSIPQTKNYALGKSKASAMFVSNCNAWNDRMGFISAVQKHISVDVYGNCGKFRCDRSQENSCFDMLKKDYYFYFAFENSNCRDYITEKLFVNGLKNDVIPIVMGAHPDDYKAMAPYKSYIHVEEFDSPKELAEYLQFLIAHPEEYNKYFEWKGTGEFISSDLFCRLCAMVHYADLVPPPERKKMRWGHAQAIESGICLGKNKWYWIPKDGKTTQNNSSFQKISSLKPKINSPKVPES